MRSHRLRTGLTTLAVTAALAGGGAAISSAATSSTSNAASTTTSQAATGASRPASPGPGTTNAKGSAPGHAPRSGGSHNCPGM
jgi:hypothetical protein